MLLGATNYYISRRNRENAERVEGWDRSGVGFLHAFVGMYILMLDIFFELESLTVRRPRSYFLRIRTNSTGETSPNPLHGFYPQR